MKLSKEEKTKLQIVIFILIFIFVSGTIAFRIIEGWSWVDSFYFLSMTVTTVGYGDLIPTTTLAKLLTVFYSFISIGLILIVLQAFSKHYIEKRYEKKINGDKKDSKNESHK